MAAAGTKDTRPQWLRMTQPFAIGGFAGCVATCVVQPIDMVKVRIQLSEAGASRSPLTIAGRLLKSEGFLAFYRGLDAGLIRQVTYTTARMGLFRVISDAMKKENETTIPAWKKAVAGLSAGGLASLVGNPADLALIRLQADTTLPLEQRRNYRGVGNALTRIVKDEGVFALWRGSLPTVCRAMALNMGMLATFDQAKEMLQPSLGTGWSNALTASALSGVAAVVLSLPFDYCKTQIQRMKADPVTGEMPYKHLFDCMAKTIRRTGITSLWTGLPTYYVRIAPHAMITLIVVDAVNKQIKRAYC